MNNKVEVEKAEVIMGIPLEKMTRNGKLSNKTLTIDQNYQSVCTIYSEQDIFGGRDYTWKCLELYSPCGPLKMSK